MTYTYASDNGVSASRAEKYDEAVLKGLYLIEREDTMPFPKLLAKLQRESETYAHRQRRAWTMTEGQRYAKEWLQTHRPLAEYWTTQLPAQKG